MKHGRKRLLSILLTLALMLGLMPGMSLTAYADNPYTGAAKIVCTGTQKEKAYNGNVLNKSVTKRCTSLPAEFTLKDLVGGFNAPLYNLTITSGSNFLIDADKQTGTVKDLGTSSFTATGETLSAIWNFDMTITVTALETYSVTLNTNGGTISEGKNVTSYVQEMGTALPTSADITNGDKVFEGWFDNSGLTGNAVTSILTTDTGNKEYWAKWKTAHTHSFTYAASGATITATCTKEGCDLPESSAGAGDHVATLTISANGGTYDGTTAYGATITDANSIQGDAKVQYQKKTDGSYGTATETAPKDAGDYKASITVGGATASVEYTIAQAATSITENPTAGEITYGQTLANSNLTGGAAIVAGSFAWKDPSIVPTVSDSQKTEYAVVFTPTDGNYGTAECKVKLTVNKSEGGGTTSANTLVYNGSAQALVTAGEAEGGTLEYALGTDDKTAPTDGWSTAIPTATEPGTYYVWYRVVGDQNHKDVDPACIVVTIGEAAVVSAPPTSSTADYTLLASLKTSGKRALKLKWTKVDGAEGYDVFFGTCGSGKCDFVTSVNGLSYKFTKLRKGSAYKAFVRAWRTEGGAKVYIGEPSPDMHAIAGGRSNKYTNPKKISVKKKKIKLAVGGTKKIKASLTKVSNSREYLNHTAKKRWFSSDRNVATVNAKGVVTAVGPGSCKIIVMAENGMRASVKVTVK